MQNQYYPALFVADFSSETVALASVGIVGTDAEHCLLGVEITVGQPFAFETAYTEDSGQRSRTYIVLSRQADGRIGLWFGMLQYLTDTVEDARRLASDSMIDDLIAGRIEPPVTLGVFPVTGGGVL